MKNVHGCHDDQIRSMWIHRAHMIDYRITVLSERISQGGLVQFDFKQLDIPAII
jgi:hypothetical protein